MCNAVKKDVKVLEAVKRRTNDERRNELIGPNFRDLIGTNSDRLVQIPIDWYEFRSIGPNSERLVRTIGPNSERLVRILNDWSEFRTNSEQMMSLTSVSSKTKKNCRIC